MEAPRCNGRRAAFARGGRRETLDLAADYFDGKEAGGEGVAAQVMRFSQPLIEAAEGDLESIERATTLGMIFWNIAVADDGSEELLAIALEHITKTEEDAAGFRALAADMVARHVEMFPELHAEPRDRCASTEA